MATQEDSDYEMNLLTQKLELSLLEHQEFVSLSEKGKIGLKLVEKYEIMNLLFKKNTYYIIGIILNIFFILNLISILVLSIIYNFSLLWGYLGIVIGFVINIISISSPIMNTRFKRSIITIILYVFILIYVFFKTNVNLNQYNIDNEEFNVYSYVIICSFIQFLNNNLTSFFSIEVVLMKLFKNKKLYEICRDRDYIELFYQKNL